MIREGSIEDVLEIVSQIPEFVNPYPIEEFKKRLNIHSIILVAEIKHHLAGFKYGYEKDTTTFYSWMGGVVPSFRRQGIASELLIEMERKCNEMGYQYLSFKTLNRHKNMLLFSLKNDFEIIDLERKREEPRIWLRKKLR